MCSKITARRSTAWTPGGHLARRAACSADFAARCPQLLEGTGLGPVLRGIEQDGLWVNRELTPGLPMFGAAVRENGELRALILLHDAAGEQLSLYYQNMFRILCGLAETAMVRAGTKPAAKQEVPGMRRNGLHADLVEKLRVDDELHRSIRVEDRAGTAATVPLEEALILDTAEQRRKLILSVLTEDPVQYYDLLQQARMNDDSEVVHYAATAMAQISKQADLALQQDARRFADDPNDREVLAAYANALERSLKLGLAQGRAAELQRRQLERLLKLQLADSPREEGYSLGCRLAEVQLQLQEYEAAEQTLEELVRRWPVRETPWLLRLRSAAARKSGAEVRSILQQMERTQVYLSAAGRQELAFWKGGPHEPAVEGAVPVGQAAAGLAGVPVAGRGFVCGAQRGAVHRGPCSDRGARSCPDQGRSTGGAGPRLPAALRQPPGERGRGKRTVETDSAGYEDSSRGRRPCRHRPGSTSGL